MVFPARLASGAVFHHCAENARNSASSTYKPTQSATRDTDQSSVGGDRRENKARSWCFKDRRPDGRRGQFSHESS
jgi:hypothetical protein